MIEKKNAKRELCIYDMSLRQLSKIDIDAFGAESLYGSDENYIFLQDHGSHANRFGPIKALYAIDKRELSGGNAKPKKIFQFAPSVEYKGYVN